MYSEIISQKNAEFEKAIEHLKSEASKVRTGRATPALVENVMVNYYGVKTPLKQIASISTPEPRSLVIQPWDRGAIAAIEGAIRESDLNLNPMNDGILVRINIPMLTEDRRKEMVKILNQKAEEARISLRSIREDAWKEIQKIEASGGMSEDDKFKGKEKLQEIVDDFNKKIEEVRVAKEKEIMTV
jgi:ribosome recycling factor